MEFSCAIQMILFKSHPTGRSSLLISSFLLIIGLGLHGHSGRVLCMMVIIVIACVLSAIMLIWEPSCESWSLPGDLKTSPSARFSNHSGRDQLSQVGSQINIITSKHTLLYNYILLNINTGSENLQVLKKRVSWQSSSDQGPTRSNNTCDGKCPLNLKQ